MWYFTLTKDELSNEQYQALQKKAVLTEVENFQEPYTTVCIFEVDPDRYAEFIDFLDLERLDYSVAAERPDREALRGV